MVIDFLLRLKLAVYFISPFNTGITVFSGITVLIPRIVKQGVVGFQELRARIREVTPNINIYYTNLCIVNQRSFTAVLGITFNILQWQTITNFKWDNYIILRSQQTRTLAVKIIQRTRQLSS